MMKQDENDFLESLEKELKKIFAYWQTHSIDHEFGGFVGRIDHYNKVDKKHPKGIILNTRILWTFSRANNFYGDQRYDGECMRAYDYLVKNFKDKTKEGVYWELDYLGNPLNKRKQIYAQAFCIYALSEYYKYSKNTEVIIWALELYHLIEIKAFDPNLGGYIEAFDENWGTIKDLRLSEKDLNAPKTTNTHLHVLEAYTTLLEVTKDITVKASLEKLIRLFLDRLFAPNNHLELFFTEDWKNLSSEVSYGHDIETVWLLIHAARITENPLLITKSEELGIKVTDTFLNEGMDKDFGIFNSKDLSTLEIDKDKHWWPQVEAMIGLIYIWKITNDNSYLDTSLKIWGFVENYIIDYTNGEWFFRVDQAGVPYKMEDKIGPWKCPYHNGRALMEILTLLETSRKEESLN